MQNQFLEYPEQYLASNDGYTGVGTRVRVIYPKDSKLRFDNTCPQGIIVRDDRTGNITIIKMDDGRFLLGLECVFMPVPNVLPTFSPELNNLIQFNPNFFYTPKR